MDTVYYTRCLREPKGDSVFLAMKGGTPEEGTAIKIKIENMNVVRV